MVQWLNCHSSRSGAAAGAVERFIPHTDVAVELGGEDAKITFFTGGMSAA